MNRLSYLPAYLPLAIPADIADQLKQVHREPSLWWIGQFVTYLLRPNQDIQHYLKQSQERLGFRRPIVGIQVRRTDKIVDTDYNGLEEYMKHVHKWFNQPSKNIIKRYPKYRFINDVNASITAKSQRFTEASLRWFLLDVHMLSMCDLDCTMTYNVFSTPEDYVMTGKETSVTTDPYIERIRSCHRNDLENVLPFVLIGILYLLVVPDTQWACTYFREFGAPRLIHTIVFLMKVPQPARVLSFTTGMAINVMMAVSVLRTVRSSF